MLEMELVEAVTRNHSKEAFARFMEYTKGAVCGMIARHAPPQVWDDLQQEAWIRIFQSLPNYKDQGKLLGYCRTIAVRVCHDYHRQQGSGPEIRNLPTQADLENLVESKSSETDSYDSSELVEKAFMLLKPQDRMLARLVILEEWSPAEAAAAMGQNGLWARVRMHRIRKQLAEGVRSWMTKK